MWLKTLGKPPILGFGSGSKVNKTTRSSVNNCFREVPLITYVDPGPYGFYERHRISVSYYKLVNQLLEVLISLSCIL